MDIVRSITVFAVAAVAEIGGAYRNWQAVRERQLWWLAAYGGVFVAGSLA